MLIHSTDPHRQSIFLSFSIKAPIKYQKARTPKSNLIPKERTAFWYGRALLFLSICKDPNLPVPRTVTAWKIQSNILAHTKPTFLKERNVATRWKEQGNCKSPSFLLAGDLGNRLPIAGYYCQGPGLLCSKLLAMATYCLWISVLAGTLRRGNSGQQGSRLGRYSQWSSLLNAEKSHESNMRKRTPMKIFLKNFLNL